MCSEQGIAGPGLLFQLALWQIGMQGIQMNQKIRLKPSSSQQMKDLLHVLLLKFQGGSWHTVNFTKHSTLNCANRWTHTNFSTFHAIQILTVRVKKLM
jgi:hypothetical protein